MDPIGTSLSVTAGLDLFLKLIVKPRHFIDTLHQYIDADWSESDTTETKVKKITAKLQTSLFQSLLPNIWHERTLIEKTVLPGDDETVERFRLFYIADCNMTAVAGAILAQVAITGLSLPQVNQTHWVTRAFFVTSLICGCFAVYFACFLHKTIGTLFKPDDLRDWLTRRDSVPFDAWTIHRILDQLEQFKKLSEDTTMAGRNDEKTDLEKGLVTCFGDLRQWQRSASLWTAFLLQLPFAYLNMSVGSFILGLAFYLGFFWTRDLDQETGKNDSRNIFIVLLVVVVACLYYFQGPALFKSLEAVPIQRWKGFQEKVDEFAASHGMSFDKGTLDPLRSDVETTKSGRTQQAGKVSASDGDKTSSMVDPADASLPLDQSSLGNLESNIFELIAALKASTASQVANNESNQILRREVANLATAINSQQ